MPFETFLRQMGIDYIVKRDSQPDRIEKGLINTEQSSGRKYIGFMPGTDILPNDVLVNPSGDLFYVIETLTDSFLKKPHQLKAYYQTKREHELTKQEPHAVFNVQNAYGSVIGTGNQATINYNSAVSELRQAVASDTSTDKEQLDKIVDLLEMVVNDQVPPSKGLFSKFREVMERNSWITGSVANALMNWLLTKTL